MDMHYMANVQLPDDWDIDKLDAACNKAGRDVAVKLFQLALEMKDEEIVASGNGAFKKKGKVPRYLITRSGILTFRREKVEQSGKCSCPLDRAVGLQPYQEATSWVKKRAYELAGNYGYRQASDLLGAEIGDTLSHTAIYGWVQKSKNALSLAPT